MSTEDESKELKLALDLLEKAVFRFSGATVGWQKAWDLEKELGVDLFPRGFDGPLARPLDELLRRQGREETADLLGQFWKVTMGGGWLPGDNGAGTLMVCSCGVKEIWHRWEARGCPTCGGEMQTCGLEGADAAEALARYYQRLLDERSAGS